MRFPVAFRPRISVIVVVYRMRRQAMNTLRSLLPGYQTGVDGSEYEVLVVENPSEEMLDPGEVRALGRGVRYFARGEPEPSPVGALELGLRKARGRVVAFAVDGARLLTPGVMEHALAAYRMTPNAVVAVPGYHLGRVLQQEDRDYGPEVEQALLESIGWPQAPYRLFEISCLSGSCAGGLYAPMAESNCFFVPRRLLARIGGIERRFRSPGGGFLNLDLYKRACEAPGAVPVLLAGEGTFHQYHGGVTTRHAPRERQALLEGMQAEYRALRGEAYRAPQVRPIHLGRMAPEVLPVVADSARRAAPDRPEA